MDRVVLRACGTAMAATAGDDAPSAAEAAADVGPEPATARTEAVAAFHAPQFHQVPGAGVVDAVCADEGADAMALLAGAVAFAVLPCIAVGVRA